MERLTDVWEETQSAAAGSATDPVRRMRELDARTKEHARTVEALTRKQKDLGLAFRASRQEAGGLSQTLNATRQQLGLFTTPRQAERLPGTLRESLVQLRALRAEMERATDPGRRDVLGRRLGVLVENAKSLTAGVEAKLDAIDTGQRRPLAPATRPPAPPIPARPLAPAAQARTGPTLGPAFAPGRLDRQALGLTPALPQSAPPQPPFTPPSPGGGQMLNSLKAQLAGIAGAFRPVEAVGRVAQRAGDAFAAVFRRLPAVAQKAGDTFVDAFRRAQRAATVGLAAATASVIGFARSGLAGTTAGAQLALQFQMLSREIAQLFLPQIRLAVQWLQRVVSWFRELTGAQQRSAGTLLLVAGAVGTLLGLIPRLTGALGGMWAALAGGGGIAAAANPAALLLSVAAAAATLGVALVASSREGRSALADLWDDLRGVAEEIGTAVGPALREAFEAARPVLHAFRDGVLDLLRGAGPGLAELARGIGPALADAAGRGADFLRALAPLGPALWDALTALYDLGAVMSRIQLRLAAALAPLLGVVLRLVEILVRTLLPVIEEIAEALDAATRPGTVLGGIFQGYVTHVATVLELLETISDTMREMRPPAWMADVYRVAQTIHNLTPGGWATSLFRATLAGGGERGDGTAKDAKGAERRPAPRDRGTRSDREALRTSATGFEGVNESINRLQLAANRVDFNTPERRTADNTARTVEQIRELIRTFERGVQQLVRNAPPPAVNQAAP